MEKLSENKLARGAKGASTLKYVDVESIKDGIIILKNGSLRSVLMVSSINFDLKSTDEQDAIISQYQNFLNSLDFPLQIVVTSRKLNIRPYLEMIKEREKQQTNEMLRMHTVEYQEFITKLTNVTNIMSKFFYIVVPFAPVETKKGGFFDRLSSTLAPKQQIIENRELFETYKNQLWQRVDHVSAGLGGTGLKLTALTTDEIIELLYNSYNPSTMTNAIIKDIGATEIQRM